MIAVPPLAVKGLLTSSASARDDAAAEMTNRPLNAYCLVPNAMCPFCEYGHCA
jgi:hypothetical protein